MSMYICTSLQFSQDIHKVISYLLWSSEFSFQVIIYNSYKGGQIFNPTSLYINIYCTLASIQQYNMLNIIALQWREDSSSHYTVEYSSMQQDDPLMKKVCDLKTNRNNESYIQLLIEEGSRKGFCNPSIHCMYVCIFGVGSLMI